MEPKAQSVAAPLPIRRPQHVLVPYERSAEGRAALSHAVDIAYAADVPLSVVAVVDHEPTNVGCARCRWNAAMWNNELDMIAEEELAEAEALVGRPATIDYEVAFGRPTTAIAEAATRCGADLIVMPRGRSGRIRHLLGRDLTELLRREGTWQVVVAPGGGTKTA